ncbi:hypothetical protein ACGFYQ_32290 [Streptomyces sp. NPDC048258]|uniref:hypothetical protein n=1 Tax=Streptomyces sp. NPDC048258 TaxID=3365527 RepID=UPI003717DE76
MNGQFTVAVCGMRRLTFLDIIGLHRLLGLAHHARARHLFFTYNWQRQPLRLRTALWVDSTCAATPSAPRQAADETLRSTASTLRTTAIASQPPQE